MSCSQQPDIPDYEMLRPIGRGAFGEVWLARAITGQFRAVKVLERAALPNQRAFDREFEGLLRYEPISRSQPNLVQVLHVGRAAGGQAFWYVMELADDASLQASDLVQRGGSHEAPRFSEALVETYEPRTLRSMLRQHGRLPVRECLPIAVGLAEAVVHLHAQGLVHRDIKPSNVIFVGGTPKLADIGLVTATAEQPSFVGTAGYIPPDGPGTPAADIYALGKVCYEMGTGRAVRDFPRLPEDFNEAPDRAALIEFNEIIVRAADLDPRRRYPSAAGLRSDLLLLSAGRSLRGLRRLERRLRLTLRAGALTLGIALVSIGLGVWANQERLRALKAEHELSVRFIEQQLSLARATRLTGLPGQRARTLEIVREAARQTNSLALRNEAIAALALPEVNHFRTIAGAQMVFDTLLRRYATNAPNGDVTVRSLEDDRPLACLSVPGGSDSSRAPAGLLAFDFSATGEHFCATLSHRQFLIWRISALPPERDRPHPGYPAGKALEPLLPRIVPLAFEPKSLFIVPGGQLAAVGEGAGILHFFDLDQGRQVRVTKGSFQSDGIAFNADGTRFACLKDNSLRIHDSATGELLQSFTNRTGFNGLIWHPDGRQIVTMSGERALRLWNLETGNPSGVLRGHEAEVVGAAFDATGQWMLSVSWDNQTVLWNLAHQREVLRLHGSGNGLRFSADARRLAWHSWDNRRWEIFELSPPSELVCLEQHPALETPEGLRSLWGVAFLDSDVIAGVGDTGFCVWQPPVGYASVLAKIGLERPFVDLPGRVLFSSGRQGLRRWPITADPAHQSFHIGPPERLLPAPASAIAEFAVSSNGFRIAFVNTNRQLSLRTERDSFGWQKLASPSVYAVAIDAPGRYLVATFMNGGVRIWNVETSTAITNLPCALGRGCSLSPDGQWLAVATSEAFLIWRVADWRLAGRIPRNAVSGPVQSWSPDGGMLLVNDSDSTVRLLLSGTWEELGALPSPKLLRQIGFSPDGSRLALASEKSGVELWNLRLLRQRLAELGLGWSGRAAWPAGHAVERPPWSIRVETGS